MSAFGPKDEPYLERDLRSETAEIAALRQALEAAREDARTAMVSAHRAAKELRRESVRAAEASRQSQAWRERYYRSHKISGATRALYRALRNWLRPDAKKTSKPVVSWWGQNAAVKSYAAKSDALKNSGTILNPQLASEPAPPPSRRAENLSALTAVTPRGRIAAVLHLYYPELWPEFQQALNTLPEHADLFVTLTNGYSDAAAEWIRTCYPAAYIVTLDNHGRDILPFLTVVNSGALFNYDLVCKLHTKRSLRRNDGEGWRRNLLAGVLADADYVTRVLAAFDCDPELGIVVAKDYLLHNQKDWEKNVDRVNALSARIGLQPVSGKTGYPGFPAGSMYWIRATLLRPIARLGLDPAEFEPEPLPADGCTAHAIERLFGHVCREAGMRIADSMEFET